MITQPLTICPIRPAKEVSALCKIVRINPNKIISEHVRKPTFIECLHREMAKNAH
jgi:hypothetical protein